MILQHLWRTQHGPSARPGMGSEEMAVLPGFGYAIPSQAADLLIGGQNGMPFVCESFA